jgi:hypothetical protein
MLEILAVITASGLVGGLGTYHGIKLHRKYLVWRNQRNWRNAGKQWKYIVDYSTRAIVPETAQEERARIEHARRFLDAVDLRASSNEVDKEFIKTLEYLQDESNPSKISDISELQEHRDRIVEQEKNAKEFRKRAELV